MPRFNQRNGYRPPFDLAGQKLAARIAWRNVSLCSVGLISREGAAVAD